MKLAIITDVLYPDHLGGTSLVPYHLSRNIDKKKFEVWVVGGLRKSTINSLEQMYAPAKLKLYNERGFFSFLTHQFKNISFLLKNKFDVIQFESLPGLRELILPFILKAGKKRIIQKIHGVPSIEANYKIRNKFLKKIYLLNWRIAILNIKLCADEIIVNSNYMKKTVSVIFPNKKIRIIPNGYDTEIWKANSNYKTKNNILYWGRISKEKGLDILVESFTKIDYEGKLYIVGDGPLRKELEEKVKSLQLEKKILFLGTKTQKEISKIAKEAELLVFPSRYEPFGMMIIEGMALSKPVIGGDVGGIKEIIKNNFNGLLAQQDSKDLTKKMNLVLKSKELQKRLARKAFITSQQYSWKNIIKSYEKIYLK